MSTSSGCARTTPATCRLRRLHPDASLRAALPDASPGIPVYILDPNGWLILRYPPGADPGGLRSDLAKLLKLI